MLRPSLSALSAAAVTFSMLSTASAEPPRDYFLNPPKAGTYGHLDVLVIGTQASLENRADLEEGMSMHHTRATTSYTWGFKEASFHMDTRVFVFTLGGSAGYKEIHKDHTFVPGGDFNLDGVVDDKDVNDRDARVDRESSNKFSKEPNQKVPWYEGRFRMTLPLGPLFMINTGTYRNENRNDQSFDWFHATVHDGGPIYRYDGVLFFRHIDFGGIGPSVRMLNIERAGKRKTEWSYGFTFATRPGFNSHPLNKNTDLFLLQVMTQNNEKFGLHGYGGAPVLVLAVYRATFKLD